MTFPPPALQSITLVPLDADDAAGRFRIWLTMNEDGPPILVWDRKVEGQFPELKHLVSFPSFYGDFLNGRCGRSVETADSGLYRARQVAWPFRQVRLRRGDDIAVN